MALALLLVLAMQGLPSSGDPCEWREFPYVVVTKEVAADGWARRQAQNYLGAVPLRREWRERLAGPLLEWRRPDGTEGTCAR